MISRAALFAAPRDAVRVVIPAAATWGASAVATQVGVPTFVLIAVWGTAVALVIAAVVTRGGTWAFGSVCLSVVALSLTSVTVHASIRQPPALRAMAGEQTSRWMTATLDSTPELRRTGVAQYRADARVNSVVIGGRDVQISAPVRLFAAASTRVWSADRPRQSASEGEGSRSRPGAAGAGVAAEQNAVRPESVLAGARIRFRARVITAGSGAAAFLVTVRGDIDVVRPPPRWSQFTGEIRRDFSARSEHLPPPGAELLPGLAIGDDSRVDPSLAQAMIDASLAHLTAVSGANCAIVVGAALLFGRALRWGRTARGVAALILLGGFVALVTPGASVARAAVMAAVVVISTCLGRPVSGLAALSWAVVILVMHAPWIAVDAGFALSVAATLGLLVLAEPLAARFARVMPGWLASLLALPVAAELLCEPILVLLEPKLSLYGVPANLLTDAAAPIATVFGLLSCLIGPICPPMADVLAQIACVPASWIAIVARAVADAPGARVAWLSGPVGSLTMALAGIGLLVAILARRASRVRWTAASLVVLAVVVFGTTTTTRMMLQIAGRPSGWLIAVCDIGQGDAILLGSHGRHALIDTGPEPRALTACLRRFEVHHLDILVLTHFDSDHVGGVSSVVGRVDHVLAGLPDGAAADRMLSRFASGGASVHEARRGVDGRLGDAAWSVLWPRAEEATPGNAASVVLEMHFGRLVAVFLGDLDEKSERALSRLGVTTPTDIVKVANHGSADQYPRLYHALDGSLALISAGRGNPYGHPRKTTLEMLEASGSQVLRTDTSGDLVIARGEGDSDDRVSVWTSGAQSVQK